MYDKAFLDELCKKNNVSKLIVKYTKVHPEGEYYVGDCPFDGTKDTMYVNYKTNTFVCYDCGVYGNPINFAMHINHCSFDEAVSFLAKRVGLDVPEKRQEEPAVLETHDILYKINAETARFFYSNLNSPIGEKGRKYFDGKRKLTKNTQIKFGLGFAPKDISLQEYLNAKGYSDEDIIASGVVGQSDNGKIYNRFKNRVMFPIIDKQNRVIGFGGRVLDDSKPKYINSPETLIFNKRENLYGLNLAQYTNRDYFICCEGNVDVISMHQAGFTSAVASLGTALTEEQVKMVSSYTNKVYLAYDSDGPGVAASIRAIDLFAAINIPVRIINMEPCKDPDEFVSKFGCNAFEERIKNAEDGVRFKVRKLKEKTENPNDYYDQMADLVLSL